MMHLQNVTSEEKRHLAKNCECLPQKVHSQNVISHLTSVPSQLRGDSVTCGVMCFTKTVLVMSTDGIPFLLTFHEH